MTAAPRARGGGLAMAAAVLLAAACTSAGDSAARPSAGRTAPPTPPPPPAAAIDAAVTSAVTDAPASTAAGDAAPVAAAPTPDAAAAPPATADYAAVVRTADWARWPGLPALRERDLVRALGLGRARAIRRDGRLGRHDAIVVEAGDVRYWLRDRDRVVLVELTQDLGSTTPADLLARLGAADREGAGRFLQSGSTTTEHVYAGRGLAVTVAASYDSPPRFAPRLAAIQLFAATDLRTFILELGGNDRAGPSH